MNETLLTIIVVVGFTAILTFFSLKKKNEEWKGYLLDKKESSYRDDNDFVKTTYTLIFKTSEGKKKKMNVDIKTFQNFIKDKKYKKEKGTYLPKEIE